jgi:hypothetical protein
MAGVITSLQDLLGLNKKQTKPKTGVVSRLPTYDSNSRDGKIVIPQFTQHTEDIFDSRSANDSRTLMANMFVHDSDISASVNGYLTLANTDLMFWVSDPTTGDIDRDLTMQLQAMVVALTEPFDYSQGFQLKPDLDTTTEEMRYMTLLRGGIGTELVFDKQLVPQRLENVDLATIQWIEKTPGEYKPFQINRGDNQEISLDIPSFWVAFHRRDPTKIYQAGNFVAAINSIAARQLVINELYSIMRTTGYSRMTVAVTEEIILKNAPVELRTNPARLREYLNDRLNQIGASLQGLKSGSPFVHWDSVKPDVINDRNPNAALDIRPVIEVLNAQNQAALKTMPTVLGRGNNAQVAGVEARYAAMCADELNKAPGMNLRRAMQFMLNVQGIPGIVHARFLPAELRPDLELEPQRVMKSSRLKDDLSLGLISDSEYHMQMHGRPAPANAPELSGTGFNNTGPQADVSAISPNADPMGQSITPQNAKSARSNENRGSGGSRVVAMLSRDDIMDLAREQIVRDEEVSRNLA